MKEKKRREESRIRRRSLIYEKSISKILIFFLFDYGIVGSPLNCRRDMFYWRNDYRNFHYISKRMLICVKS